MRTSIAPSNCTSNLLYRHGQCLNFHKRAGYSGDWRDLKGRERGWVSLNVFDGDWATLRTPGQFTHWPRNCRGGWAYEQQRKIWGLVQELASQRTSQKTWIEYKCYNILPRDRLHSVRLSVSHTRVSCENGYTRMINHFSPPGGVVPSF